MGFKDFAKKIKKWALKVKNTIAEKVDDAIDYWAQKIASKSIDDMQELQDFIDESKQKIFTNEKTGETKIFDANLIVVFGDEKSDFFKKAIINLPIISTKAFSENAKIRLAKSNIKWLNVKEYDIKEFPALVLFRNQKVFKTINWEENVEKIIKSFTMNMVTQIENF